MEFKISIKHSVEFNWNANSSLSSVQLKVLSFYHHRKFTTCEFYFPITLLYSRLFSLLLTVLPSPSFILSSSFSFPSSFPLKIFFSRSAIIARFNVNIYQLPGSLFPCVPYRTRSPSHTRVDRDRRAIQLSIFRVTTVLTDHVNDTLASVHRRRLFRLGNSLQPPVGRIGRGISMSQGRSRSIDRSFEIQRLSWRGIF